MQQIDSSFFSADQQATVSAAIAAAELKNRGEIVPVIAPNSGRYDRAEDFVGVVAGLVLVSCAWPFLHYLRPVANSWANATIPGLDWMVVIGLFLIGFTLGSRCSARIDSIRALFVSRKEMQEEVERRACESFYRYGVGRTGAETGVLVYVSLFEKMVRIEGDTAIDARLNEQDWQSVCDSIANGLKNEDACGGLCQGIAQIGTLLTQHFPHDDATDVLDENERPDEVLFASGR